MRRMLNVGGGNKRISIPPFYEGWEHVLLDIDPAGHPDIVCDARELNQLPPCKFDAVYCSHNLEHYYRHEVLKVLSGFLHVLKPDGFAHVRVPDIGLLMRIVVERSLDIDDLLYESAAGPISVGDVIYGYGVEIERSGQHFYAHKTGFTEKSLRGALNRAGFPYVFMSSGSLEIGAIACKIPPSEFTVKLLGLRFQSA